MRRTESEIKAELLKRRDRYFAKKQKIKNSIIAAVLCLCMVAASVSVVFMLPEDDDEGDNVLHGSEIQTPFDSSVPDGSIADDGQSKGPQISAEPGGEESTEASEVQSEDITLENNSSDIIIGSGEISGAGSGSVDTSQDPQPPLDYDKNVEVDMVYPEMPDDGSSLNLLKTLSASGVNGNPISFSFAAAYGDFSAGFFKGCAVGQENALVSPLSMMLVLSMAANGAAGETKWAMEQALGGFPIEELNKYLYTYLKGMPSYKNSSLSVKNAVWVKDGSGINKGFLQNCLDYYGAEAYMAPFTNATKDEINNWISENTGGDIKEMLKEISPTAMMYLVNAIEFDAEWKRHLVEASEAASKAFTNADGSVTNVEYMVGGDDNGKYIETYNATGFIKDYEGDYSFVALLPKNENGLDTLVSSLSGSGILSMLNGHKTTKIQYVIPKFSFSTSVSSDLIKETLTDMGMGVAFDEFLADFRRVHDDGAYIEDVFQDTTIKVNRKGTRATAASIVVMAPPTGGGPDYPYVEPIIIRLDRPFVYMIVDRTSNMPIFMGTVTNMAKSKGGVEIDPVITEIHHGSGYDLPLNEGVFIVDSESAENPEVSSEEFSEDISEDTSADYYPGTGVTEPEVSSVTVINSMEEYDEYSQSVPELSEYFEHIKNFDMYGGYFYGNVLIIVEIDEPYANKSYRLGSVYGYSDTEDSIELVLEYNRVDDSYGSGSSGARFYLVTMVDYEVYEQVDGVTVRFN